MVSPPPPPLPPLPCWGSLAACVLLGFRVFGDQHGDQHPLLRLSEVITLGTRSDSSFRAPSSQIVKSPHSGKLVAAERRRVGGGDDKVSSDYHRAVRPRHSPLPPRACGCSPLPRPSCHRCGATPGCTDLMRTVWTRQDSCRVNGRVPPPSPPEASPCQCPSPSSGPFPEVRCP